ncbi:MAG: lytic transglycosylase domain-containing protein [Bacteroidales bacterium]|nr:lytic transglycosylase domain-containing protein [Bacteroidales bacterium]
MRKKDILNTFISCTLTAAIFFIGTHFLQSHQANDEQNSPRSQVPYNVTSPQVPASIEFAGENIDLTRCDIRERMDREILTFTYSHINTQLMLKRANRLFPVIEPILKKQGLPDDFKYLMIIESNGDIYARSAVGAAGLWQFMPATGKQYGLEVNNSIDERYNIEKSTRAACRYLKNSYKTFGDWLTVAASHNAGEAGINKRLTSQKETKAINTCLLPETSRYIFRILTAKLIFSDPARYGFLLRSSDLYPPMTMADTIEVDDAVINFTDIAKNNGLNFMQLRDANPWIRSTSAKNTARKSYKVLIPSKESLNYNPQATKAHNSAWVIK